MIVDALAPIFSFFLIGVALRASGVVQPGHAPLLFRIVFFVTLPCLAYGVISTKSLAPGSVGLPLAGFGVNAACGLLAWAYVRVKGLPSAAAGTLILGASIANTVLVFPYVLTVLGPAALGDAMLYDIGNALYVAVVGYTIASVYGQAGGVRTRQAVVRTLRSPLLLAVLAAVVVSVTGVVTPALILTVIEPLGQATVPLILMALGVAFTTTRLRDSVVGATVGIRMAGGFAAGAAILMLFDFERDTALAILAMAAAPVGFNAVTLASIAGLDTEQGTAALSTSVAIGLFSSALILLGARAWLGT